MKNFKSNINRPEISSEEINAGKNFDETFSEYTKMKKPFYKQKWFIANSIIAVVAIFVTAGVLINNNIEGSTNGIENNIQPLTEEVLLTDETRTSVDANLKPFVSPPIKGLNVPFSSYIVQSNKGKTIKHHSGSILKIPKNAFVNEEGDLVKGKVEIRYREFKDIAEIFASGIPMTYNKDGEEFHFESAGMVEILAYQNNEPVFMHPKKKIDIEMTSDYAGTQYNLYHLDTINREWVYRGKDKVIIKSEQREEIVDFDDSETPDSVAPWGANNLEQPDEASNLAQNIELKTIAKEIKVIQKDIVKIKKTAPKKPAKATNSRFRFNLDVNSNEFPEMSVYEGLEFEIGKENKNFDPKLTNKQWHDIALSKNEKGKYELTLKRYFTKDEDITSESEMDVKKFIVYPVYEGENYKTAMKDFNEKFKDYSKILNKRKDDERVKKEAYEKKLAEIKAENERLRKEWEANASERQQAYKTTRQIYRAFSAYQFGTLNCDSPIRRPSGQTIAATFVNDVKKNLNISSLFLVEKSRNAVFPYYSQNGSIKFDPRAKNILVGVTSDNKLITFTYEQFKAIPKTKRSHDFEMKVEESTPENIKELKKCISFL